MDVKRYFRGPVMWMVLAVLAVVVLMQVVGSSGGYKTVDTGQVVKAITDNKVKSAELTTGDENKIKVELSGDNKVDGSNKLQASYIGDQGVDLAKTLQARYQTGEIKDGYTVSPSKQNPFVGMLISLLPFVLIVVIFLFLMNQMQGGGSRVMNFGKSKAKLITKDTPKTTFSDVAGSDEAVEELQEIKEFLQEPAKFQAVGAKIPKGVLLYGPPGTGKTLLARAVAGEAGVPFTRSPAPTSSRCSWVSVPPGSVTCSSRPRRTPRRSSSSTRSTPSAGTAARASAAATTSASRR
ncbi:ATP-dependent zinc metalloprotease FtsH [Streptomyces rimosus subsp. rimosus]